MSKISTGRIIETLQAAELEILDIEEEIANEKGVDIDHSASGDMIVSLRSTLLILQEEIRGERICANHIWGCFNKVELGEYDDIDAKDCPTCEKLGVDKAIKMLKDNKPYNVSDVRKLAKAREMMVRAKEESERRHSPARARLEALRAETESLLED